MNNIVEKIKTFCIEDIGLSAVEYIVAGALIVVVLIAGFVLLGTTVDNRLLFFRNSLSLE